MKNQIMNIISIEQFYQKQKMIQPIMIQNNKRLVKYCYPNIKIQNDEQIYKELNFINNQIETIKNVQKLKLCDSINSGRNKSNNPSIISSKTLENMNSKLSHIYTNNSVNHTSRLRNFNNYTVEKQYDLNQKQQGNHKISNSFIKWKIKLNKLNKLKIIIIFNKVHTISTYFVYSQDQITHQLFNQWVRIKLKLIMMINVKTNSPIKFIHQKNNLITTLNQIDCFYNKTRFQKNFMIIGGKSTSKKKIVEQLIRSMIFQLQSKILSFKI